MMHYLKCGYCGDVSFVVIKKEIIFPIEYIYLQCQNCENHITLLPLSDNADWKRYEASSILEQTIKDRDEK